MKPLPEADPACPHLAPWSPAEGKPYTDMTSAKAAAHDTAHPLPHPGYRAGQVWAREDGSSVVVSRVLLEHNTVLFDIVGSGWHIEQFARAYPYLMADPACPHLAPWSPAEVKS